MANIKNICVNKLSRKTLDKEKAYNNEDFQLSSKTFNFNHINKIEFVCIWVFRSNCGKRIWWKIRCKAAKTCYPERGNIKSGDTVTIGFDT